VPRANLIGASMRRTTLEAQSRGFRPVDAVPREANLKAPTFRRRPVGADLTGANLAGADLGVAAVAPSSPAPISWVNFKAR
jgi:uncharacterized protein YjbI with pentapeptide repeats